MDQTIQEHFYLLCRLCGRTVLKSVKFQEQSREKFANDEASLTEKIYDCIGLQIKNIDQLPQQICHTCFDKINDYFEFRVLCELTNVELRKLKICSKNGRNDRNEANVDSENKNDDSESNADDSDYSLDEQNSNDFESVSIKVETNSNLLKQFILETEVDSEQAPSTSRGTKRLTLRRSPSPLSKGDQRKNNKKIRKSEDIISSGDDIPYEFINGTRIDSHILYLPHEEQLYRRKSTYGAEDRYICRIKNCGSSIFYHVPTKKVLQKLESRHNHGTQISLYQKLLVETEIKEAVINSLDVDIQTIYNDIVSKSNVPGVPEFKSMRRNLQRIRNEAIFKQQMCREERL